MLNERQVQRGVRFAYSRICRMSRSKREPWGK